jgi:hypothetical protein
MKATNTEFFPQSHPPVYEPSDETLFVYIEGSVPVSVKVDVSDRDNPSQISTDNISIAGYIPEDYDPETDYYLTSRAGPDDVYVLDRDGDAVVSKLSAVVSTSVFDAQTVNQRYAIVVREDGTSTKLSLIDMDSDAVVDEVTGVNIDDLSVSNETAVAVSNFEDVLYYDLSGGTISLMHSESYPDTDTYTTVISDERYHYVTNYDDALQTEIGDHKLRKWDSQNPTNPPYEGREVHGTAVAVDPVNRDIFAMTWLEGAGFPYGTVYAEDDSVKGTMGNSGGYDAVFPTALVDSNGYRVDVPDLQHIPLVEYSGESISEGDSIEGTTVSKIEDGYIYVESDTGGRLYESLATYFGG